MEWDIREHNLDGIQLTTIHVTGTPLVSAKVQMNVGSLHEYPSHKRGVAHFFEHLPFEGTTKFPGRIHSHTNEINARVGAGTSYETTVFDLTVPVTNWRQGTEIMADMIQSATLAPSVVISEGLTIANEVRERPFSYPLEAIYLDKAKFMVGNDPRYQVIPGSRQDILSIRREDLLQFRDEFYNRENCRIVLHGDIPHADMRDVAAELFSSLPHGAPAQKIIFSVPGGYNLLPISSFEDAKNHIAFSVKAGSCTPQENALRWILTRYFVDASAPVMEDLRDKSKLVYGMYDSSAWMSSLNYFEIGFVCAPQEGESYASKIVNHSINLVEGASGERVLERVKGTMLRDIANYISVEKHPSIGNVQDMYSRYGRLVTPEENTTVIEKLTYEDLVECTRQIMAGTPSFFAFGNIDGLFAKQRFEEMIRPLTEISRSYCQKSQYGTKEFR